MPTPVILQAFDADNPPTVDQINTYFRTIVTALNALAGEPVIEWSSAAPAEGVFLPITGGTLTGPLTLSGNATNALHAVPKQQFDAAMAKAGGTFTGGVTFYYGTSADTNVVLNKAAGKNGQFIFQLAGVVRWNVTNKDDDNFSMQRFSGAGSYLQEFLLVDASTGRVVLGGPPGGSPASSLTLDTNLDLSAPGYVRFMTAGRPNTDNAHDFGTGPFRWANIYAANGTIQTSDEREKTDIIDCPLGLDFLKTLRPVAFRWKVGANLVSQDENGHQVVTPRPGVRRHFGLLAQQVKAALGGEDFGGYIHDAETGRQGLRYDQFVAILIQAVQELDAKKADR